MAMVKPNVAPSIARGTKRRESEVAGTLRRRIDVMKAAGIPDKEIETFIRGEFAKRDEERRRRDAATKLGTPP